MATSDTQKVASPVGSVQLSGHLRRRTLGTITASADFARVGLSDLANGFVIADGLRFVEVKSAVVDDGDAAYAESQAWTAGGLTGAYGGDYRVRPAGTGQYKATWSFPALTSGKSYDVFVTWLADANRASNAVFTIKDDGVLIQTVTVNQKLAPDTDLFNGSKWKSLGQFVASGTLTIELTDAADGYVIADAIRLVQTGSLAIDDGNIGFSKTRRRLDGGGRSNRRGRRSLGAAGRNRRKHSRRAHQCRERLRHRGRGANPADLWPLTDHLGTVRDAMDLSPSGQVEHVLHRAYNAFGSLTSETNPSVRSAPAADVLFGFTSRPFDNPPVSAITYTVGMTRSPGSGRVKIRSDLKVVMRIFNVMFAIMPLTALILQD